MLTTHSIPSSGFFIVKHRYSMKTGTFSRQVVTSAAYTTTFNSDSDDCEPFSFAVAYLDVTAASGTSPTLDITIEESIDGSTWFDSGFAFTQVTATEKQKLLIDNLGGLFYRANCTIAGTSPSFTFTLDFVGKRN